MEEGDTFPLLSFVTIFARERVRNGSQSGTGRVFWFAFGVRESERDGRICCDVFGMPGAEKTGVDSCTVA